MTPELIDDWLGNGQNCDELAGLGYIDPRSIRKNMAVKLPLMERLGRQGLPPICRIVR